MVLNVYVALSLFITPPPTPLHGELTHSVPFKLLLLTHILPLPFVKSGLFLPVPPQSHCAGTWWLCGTFFLSVTQNIWRLWVRILTEQELWHRQKFWLFMYFSLRTQPPSAFFCEEDFDVFCSDRAGWQPHHFFCTLTGRITHIRRWHRKFVLWLTCMSCCCLFLSVFACEQQVGAVVE